MEKPRFSAYFFMAEEERDLVGGFSGQATRTERVCFNESLAALHGDPSLRCEGRYGPLLAGSAVGSASPIFSDGRGERASSPRFIVVPIGH